MKEAVVGTVQELLSFLSQSLDRWVWKGDFANHTSRHLRTAFVAEMTFLNAVVIVFVLYFWVVNRQAHIRNTRGSMVVHKAGKLGELDSEEEETVGFPKKNGNEKEHRRMLSVRQSKVYESLIECDIERDDDDSDDELESPSVQERKKRHPTVEQQGLVDVVKTMKLFSYLNEDALKVCLKYVETVNVPIGKHVFERDKFDGSLYAVISGRVRCQFHDFELPKEEPLQEDEDDTDDDEKERLLCFSSGPGHVVTPLLSVLFALVKEQTKKDGRSYKLPNAPNVSAVATATNTRLIRIPPACFSAVLERFPAEVFRIAQTTVSRVRRIAVLTLVNTLGLRRELLNWKESEMHIYGGGTRLSEWRRLTSALEKRYKSKGENESIDKTVKDDAAVVAAAQLGCGGKDRKCIALLRDHSSVVTLGAGDTLIQWGTHQDSVYLLLRGTVEVGIPMPKKRSTLSGSGEPSFSFHRYRKVKPGTLLGTLDCFGSDESIFSARCCDQDGEGCTLLKIPKEVFTEIVVSYPNAMTRCLDLLFSQISPVVHLLNWNSEWMHVQAAEAIAERGSPCDSMFIVLSGRLRAKFQHGSSVSPKNFEEYGRGKFVGDIGGLTESPWPCDVCAIRNSELARVPIRTLVAIVRAYPAAGLHLARVIASRVKSRYKGEGPRLGPRPRLARKVPPTIMPSYGLTLATVAVVSLSSKVDLSDFSATLASSLGKIASTKLMTKALARDHLGERVYRQRNAMHDLKMTRLLAEMEENYRLVVYQADLKFTWWTKLCVQQADCILLAVDADRAPDRKRVEQCLAWASESMDVRIELVVVGQVDQNVMEPDDDDYDKDNELNVSDQLNNWSEERQWITGHHLVRIPFGVHKLDFDRLCRRVTGLSVGLVLGGGGARGLAHLGVIRALNEAGVSIDLVGGTSQGAFVGALYAKMPDNFESLMKASRAMSEKMASTKEKLFDLTLPMTSMFTGRSFNNVIRKLLGTIRIQDLVLNFFCVTTDIQKRELVVHSKGLLWKYVRASMSLSGYLPPVSEEGSLLVDGGYLNVLPADVMRDQFRARTVIAVDVSPENEREYCDYGMHLSGWWLLWNSWNPFVETVKVPSMGDISDSLRWVSSDQHRKTMARASDLLLTPPIQEYGTLEFDKFDEIVEKSFVYSKPIVDEWVKRNPWLSSSHKSERMIKI